MISKFYCVQRKMGKDKMVTFHHSLFSTRPLSQRHRGTWTAAKCERRLNWGLDKIYRTKWIRAKYLYFTHPLQKLSFVCFLLSSLLCTFYCLLKMERCTSYSWKMCLESLCRYLTACFACCLSNPDPPKAITC